MASETIGRPWPPYIGQFPAEAVEDLDDLRSGVPVLCWYNGSDTANIPETGRHGVCLHFASSSSWAVQIALVVGRNYLYIRSKASGTWSAWTQIT